MGGNSKREKRSIGRMVSKQSFVSYDITFSDEGI
jgi:hypothetical protein